MSSASPHLPRTEAAAIGESSDKLLRVTTLKSPSRAGAYCLALIVLVIATYWPATQGEFVQWDDDLMIVQNPALNPPTWTSLRERWTAPYENLYTPVADTVWPGIALAAR